MTTDPRTPNCRAFHVTADGKVDGVNLVYEERPATKYQLVYATLIDETQTQATVATFDVLDTNGISITLPVWLAWPYPDLSNRVLPGNQQKQHMITSTYDAARGVTGPLALYVGDAAGNPISDVLGGLGLPNSRHVSYALVWKERATGSGTGTPVDPPVNEYEEHMLEQVADALAELEAIHALLGSMSTVLAKLAVHLGA